MLATQLKKNKNNSTQKRSNYLIMSAVVSRGGGLLMLLKETLGGCGLLPAVTAQDGRRGQTRRVQGRQRRVVEALIAPSTAKGSVEHEAAVVVSRLVKESRRSDACTDNLATAVDVTMATDGTRDC